MLIPIDGTQVSVQAAGVVDLDSSVLFMAALFLAFFFLYHRIFVKGLVDMFDKRHALTAGAREAAERAVKDAQAKISEYDTQIGDVRRRAVDETKRLRSEAETRERARTEAARAAAAKQVESGLVELNSAASQARVELDRSAREIGERIATKILGGAA